MSTTLYIIIARDADGKVYHRLGGGSSTAASPRVYDSRKKAEAQLPYCHGVKYSGVKMTAEIVEVEV